MSFFTGRNFMASPGLRAGGTITGDLVITGTAAVTGATTLTGALAMNNTLTMGAGKQILADFGTDAAPGYAFVAATGNGMTNKAAGTDNIVGLSRSGVNQVNLQASKVQVATNFPLETNASLYPQNAFRIDGETIKTVSYQITTSDVIVIVNDAGGAALTATLPAAPLADQLCWIKHIGTNVAGLTIARNGKNIDGAGADLVLLTTGECALLYYDGTGWYRIGT